MNRPSAVSRRQRDLLAASGLLGPRLPRILAAVALGVLSLGSALALAGVSAWLITRAWQMPPVLDLSVAVVAVRAFAISRGVLHYCERLATHDTALRGRRPGPHPYLSPAGPRTGGGRRRAAQRGPGSTRRRGRRRTGQHAGACSGADSRRSGAGSSRDRGRRGRFGASRRGTGGLPFGCRRCCALACRQNRRSAGSDRPPTSGHARHVGDDRP